MQQFEAAKAAHPDAILFFRLGDFYEMFRDDAVLVSRLLNLTLTSRNKGAPDEIPMAGVPHHAAHNYLARLLALGHKVALCEQMGDPSKIKGIVPRQVVRVLTPGLITDADQLEARENHFLGAVQMPAPGSEAVGEHGLALLDISTGELAAASFEDAASLLAELARAEPREILLSSASESLRSAISSALPRAALRDDDPLDADRIGAEIDGALAAPLYEDESSHHPTSAMAAAARALRFAARCTPGVKLPVRRIARLEPAESLRIDETAQVHLELTRNQEGQRQGSLIDVLDTTVSAAGGRMLRRRLVSPLRSVAEIRRRQDEVEAFVVHARARQELRDAMARVTDLERLTVRALLGEASPRDLGGVRDGLNAAPDVLRVIDKLPDPGAQSTLLGDASSTEEVDAVPDVARTLTAAIVERAPPHTREGGFIRDGFDQELDALRRKKLGGTEEILALEKRLREGTGISGLRVKYTRVFGWYVEVTKTHLAKVPDAWHRKQTVAGGERYTFAELDDLAADIESAEDRALELEQSIAKRLVKLAADHADRVRALARRLARWDTAAALADVAHRHDYARPVVDDSDGLHVVGGRHPVVERTAAAGRFVPNDTHLELDGERLWLVTGPNMAGKSTLMRQVALIVVLAQMGSYVPATSAHIGVVDRILSRVGASDNLARGESTFMVEMRETATILREATRRSLVILDEIGRGTSTYDGLAIAWAVAEHLHDAVCCRAMFATHYHELTELASTAAGVANVSVSAREHGEEVVFLHTLVKGPASRSYGVAVAKLAGVPEPVLARARAILSSLEGDRGPAVGPSRQRPSPQLDLFSQKPSAEDVGAESALGTLRAVDVDRLTPLDALQLIAKLKTLIEPPT